MKLQRRVSSRFPLASDDAAIDYSKLEPTAGSNAIVYGVVQSCTGKLGIRENSATLLVTIVRLFARQIEAISRS